MAMVRRVGEGSSTVGSVDHKRLQSQPQVLSKQPMMVGSDAASAVVGARAHACSSQWRSGLRSYMGENQKGETIEQFIIYGTAGTHIGSAHAAETTLSHLLATHLCTRLARAFEQPVAADGFDEHEQ